MMIKIVSGLLGCIFIVLCSVVWATKTPFPYADNQPAGANVDNGSIKDQVKLAVIDSQGPIQRLIKVFLPNRPVGEGVLGYIQYVINIALGLVAFVGLIVLIYGFYGIIFRSSQEGIDNAKKTVKGAFIAIVLMGASRLIVKLMFYIIIQLQ